MNLSMHMNLLMQIIYLFNIPKLKESLQEFTSLNILFIILLGNLL